jgi:light-regulated signal transduction histidine kinase (bacteriophytochrome)
VDLSSCDKEPIQFIETIQKGGALFVIDADGIIVRAATSPAINIKDTDALGQTIDKVIGDINRLGKSSLAQRSDTSTPLLIKSQALGQWITCTMLHIDNMRVAEVEPVLSSSATVPSVKFKTDRLESIESYMSYAAENVQTITGYDRVMVYRFAPDWHGEVIAEARDLRSNIPSYLGHHFPASDIPAPARELFVKNWVRMIADVDAPTYPIKSARAHTKPIDLSRSALRAASPIHIEYLQNMGVKATLTMSLICDGKLWGLIACHHYAPKRIEAQQRAVLSLIAKLISAKLTSLSVGEVLKSSNETAVFIKEFSANLITRELKLIEIVRDHKKALHNMIKCDGFAYLEKTDFVLDGATPSRGQLELLLDSLQSSDDLSMVTEQVGKDIPELADLSETAAGLIAVKVENAWFVWFRREWARSITWAGDPDTAKTQIKLPSGATRLTPRLSFQSWQETVKGMSSHWAQSEIDAAKKLQNEVSENIQKTSHERLQNISYLDDLNESIQKQAAELGQIFDIDEMADFAEK